MWKFKDRRGENAEEESPAQTEDQATTTAVDAVAPDPAEELEQAEKLGDNAFRTAQAKAAEIAKTERGQQLFSVMVFSRRLYAMSYGLMQGLIMANAGDDMVDKLVVGAT